MRRLLLLLFVLLALQATFARAEESPAEAMVAKAQQVAEAVKEHFQTLADSEVVQQARGWFTEHATQVYNYFKDKIPETWVTAPAAA